MSWEIGRRSVIGWGGAMLASMPVLAQPQRPIQHVVQLAIGTQSASAFQHLPLILAQALGYFRSEGVMLHIRPTRSEAQALSMVARGQADVGAVGFEQLALQPVHTSRWCQAFVLEGRAPQVALGMVVPGRNPQALQGVSITSLQGKCIGIDMLGSMAHMVTVRMLLGAGVSSRRYTLLPIGAGQQALQALKDGEVDALCLGDPVIAQLEQAGQLKVLADMRTPSGASALLGGTVPGGCLAASAQWLQSNTGAAQAMTNAIVRAIKWLHTAAPNDIVRLVPQEDFLNDRAVYLGALSRARNSIALDGLMPERAQAAMSRLLSAWAGTVPVPQVSRLYVSEYAQRARAQWLV